MNNENDLTPNQNDAGSEANTQTLVDLTVDGETEAEIKGGLLLPAVQKVREAATRITT